MPRLRTVTRPLARAHRASAGRIGIVQRHTTDLDVDPKSVVCRFSFKVKDWVKTGYLTECPGSGLPDLPYPDADRTAIMKRTQVQRAGTCSF